MRFGIANKAKGLEDILLKQYGAWENANQIPFDQLPDHFILKANNAKIIGLIAQ